MAKFNEEIVNEKFLEDKKAKEECAMYLQSLLSKEEHEKLEEDWKAAGGFKTIPYWKFVFENVKVSYENGESD